MKQLNTTTWGTGGNTCTISDSYVFPNSYILVVPTSAPAIGNWAVTSTSEGSFTITSSDPENSALTITYIVL